MTEQGIVEAALYSAGRALAVEEIAQTTSLSPDVVRDSLAALASVYDERGSAIQVARIGDKWAMQIRAEYVERAQTFAPPEVAKDLLKTAALIAYYQPVKQSEIVRMVGGKAYDQVRALVDLNLVTANPLGQTLELRTSPHFPEFFGLPTTEREEIKRVLAERAGISPTAKPTPAPPPDASSAESAAGTS